MDTDFRVTGKNTAAPFSLTIHRGDGMVLLGMNWKAGRPPANFAGFAIQYREPGVQFFKTVHNRIGFPGQPVPDDGIRTTEAPIQKFRWVHFPFSADLEGPFLYRVTAMFMDATGTLSKGEAQEAELALMRETIPGKLNVAFTRGFVASQAFVRNFSAGGPIITLVPPDGDEGLDFVPTHADAERALAWMGFEARKETLALLDFARDTDAEVRVIAYDLNLPEVVERLEALGPRLRIIIDDSARTKGHGRPNSPETHAAERLVASAGSANVKRQHMANLQHQKSIAVRGGGIATVLYGSTNLSWRGLFVQSNNSLAVHSASAVDDYFAAFDRYFAAKRADDFRASTSSAGWLDLGLPGVDARVAFSPHSETNGRLDEIGADIDAAEFERALLARLPRPDHQGANRPRARPRAGEARRPRHGRRRRAGEGRQPRSDGADPRQPPPRGARGRAHRQRPAAVPDRALGPCRHRRQATRHADAPQVRRTRLRQADGAGLPRLIQLLGTRR